MAFVPKYEHDVFVSYAHLDNEGTPWVTTLVDKLSSEMQQRLGTRDFRIWRDNELAGNRPLTPEIMEAIRCSATLLIVMSPGYLNSEWCARERNQFLEFAHKCINEGRIFIIHCRETDRNARAAEFRDLVGFQFWIKDSEAGTTRPLGMPDANERAYYTGILNLSDKIEATLKELRDRKTDEPGKPKNDRVKIFLARSTDDMETREEELRSYLTQAGVEILPKVWYSESDEQAFRKQMLSDLDECSLFVQLLSRTLGRKPQFADQRYPLIQYGIAKNAGKPVLQWRGPAEDPSTVENAAHRALLEMARAGGFEEFKRAVVEKARRKPQPSPTRPAQVAVFVNADREDVAVARQVGELLSQQDVGCFLPLMQGSPDTLRKDLESNLKTCDGLVLVYGKSEPTWVRDQLRQSRKILNQRDQALAAWAIYLGPPQEKPDLALAIQDLITMDGRTELSAQTLQPFVEQLKRSNL